jgi:hypothetical protein
MSDAGISDDSDKVPSGGDQDEKLNKLAGAFKTILEVFLCVYALPTSSA